MEDQFVFSYAENEKGELVHVDSVPRGKNCGCICPYCREKLGARHGNYRAHGFFHLSHRSEERGANLDICYKVILYKLAEQIIKTHRKIFAPSYYGIFRGQNIEFFDVQIDSSYERDDKQPDVVAMTKDGAQYLIELTFKYKIQHKKAIDYKNLNCIEIDLNNQTHDSLEKFLLSSDKDRKWLNNEKLFGEIEERYKAANKNVRVVSVNECEQCEVKKKKSCCAVKEIKSQNQYDTPYLVIENNGENYLICKTDSYNELKKRIEEEDKSKDLWVPQEEEHQLQYDISNHNTWQPLYYSTPKPKEIEVSYTPTAYDKNIASIVKSMAEGNKPTCEFLQWIYSLEPERRKEALYNHKRDNCHGCPHHSEMKGGRWHICNLYPVS